MGLTCVREDNGFVAKAFFLTVSLLVDDFHLFDDGAFARLPGAEKQQLHFLQQKHRAVELICMLTHC